LQMELTKRQNEIVDAAVRLIAEKGIQELTVKNLAGRIKVSEPALYRHFTNKTDIVRALISRFSALATGEDDSGGLRGFAAIRAFVSSRTEILLQEPALSRVMFCEEFFYSDPEFSGQMQQTMQRHRSWIEARLKEGIADGAIRGDLPADVLFRLVMGPVRLLFKQWGMNGMKFDLRAACEEQLSVLENLLQSGKGKIKTFLNEQTA